MNHAFHCNAKRNRFRNFYLLVFSVFMQAKCMKIRFVVEFTMKLPAYFP